MPRTDYINVGRVALNLPEPPDDSNLQSFIYLGETSAVHNPMALHAMHTLRRSMIIHSRQHIETTLKEQEDFTESDITVFTEAFERKRLSVNFEDYLHLIQNYKAYCKGQNPMHWDQAQFLHDYNDQRHTPDYRKRFSNPTSVDFPWQ